ncbi:GH92 family glycosyl hydrolase [Amycolatopsis sp. H20-H5]|uniref:GH92 family glycosyl hydrolase n=1 Tax=Amycolatopsis sp. H20-H5 TaxID=3046309 RepID=UPI002DBA8F24|nr:GH92 family glycosyl hydrolase [Amycolatopsis sp. H20-H5]MEC3977838.1 GH92 family glycosyl hydrolase [Amycolatopsis sp. H20-H5]
MRRYAVVALTVALIGSMTTMTAAASPGWVTSPASYVDPLIGSARDGNTFPGATTPSGMLSWSPTSTRGDQTSTGAANGYQYDTTRLRGFSLTHVDGAGCNPGAAGDIPIMPIAADVTSSPSADKTDAIYASDFAHTDESAKPGRYTLGLANGVKTDFAATDRAGIGTFAFPADKPANLLFRTSNSLNGSEDAEIHLDQANRQVTGSVLTGAFCGRRANGGVNNRKTYYRLHFVAQFDQAFTATGTWRDAQLAPGGTDTTGGEGYATGSARAGRGSGGYVTFDPAHKVTMKIALSYVSLEGAEQNLRAELSPRSSVESVASAASRAWNERLGRVRIGGGTEGQRQVFYTALYHGLMQPNLVSDVDGRYLGMDQQVHRLEPGQDAQYGNFSGWDQYRAQIQLLALLEPRIAGNFAQSLFNYAKQNDGVWDRWVHVNGATHVMTGDPSAATIATFYAMGVRNFDVRGAFESLYRQATVPRPEGLQDGGCPGQCVGQRPNLAQYLTSHYSANDVCHCWGGAAETLEDSVADFSLAQWARELGRDKEYRELSERGSYWRNVFNPATGYMQARNLDGGWVTPFDPASDRGFAQGSSATYTWMVPQDVTGLAAAMGGKDKAVPRLDAFFHDAQGNWKLTGGGPLKYDPTNEPGIHAPWLYNELGQPWKTQETVRELVNTVYTTGPAGLPGNDDLGTMSAWYVFAALGIYPRTPGSAEMLLSSPLFSQALVLPEHGAPTLITATGDGKYVQSVRRNGLPYHDWKLDGAFLQHGGLLNFQLSTNP